LPHHPSITRFGSALALGDEQDLRAAATAASSGASAASMIE
jgi:hypothetical protein